MRRENNLAIPPDSTITSPISPKNLWFFQLSLKCWFTYRQPVPCYSMRHWRQISRTRRDLDSWKNYVIGWRTRWRITLTRWENDFPANQGLSSRQFRSILMMFSDIIIQIQNVTKFLKKIIFRSWNSMIYELVGGLSIVIANAQWIFNGKRSENKSLTLTSMKFKAKRFNQC